MCDGSTPPFGPLVYWLGHRVLNSKKGDRYSCGLRNDPAIRVRVEARPVPTRGRKESQVVDRRGVPTANAELLQAQDDGRRRAFQALECGFESRRPLSLVIPPSCKMTSGPVSWSRPCRGINDDLGRATFCGRSSMAERDLAKVEAVGSIPIVRSI